MPSGRIGVIGRSVATQKLGHQLVIKIRAELAPVTGPATSERTFTTEHGTVAKMNTAAIGKMPAPST
jgi:hypothetical protein